jgi:hypothetical protein
MRSMGMACHSVLLMQLAEEYEQHRRRRSTGFKRQFQSQYGVVYNIRNFWFHRGDVSELLYAPSAAFRNDWC